MRILILIFLILGYSTVKAAQTDCGPFTVQYIQAENPGVLVYLRDSNNNNVVKSLGSWTDAWTKSFQAIAQQAFATDQKVIIRFIHSEPEFDCTKGEYYSSKPYMIRIFK